MHWFRRHSRGRPPHPDVLTPAEWRVLELVREDRPNAEIAVRLGITVPTVKTHITRILAKTGTRNRAELGRWDGRPSEASRAALGRGFAPPLIGWLTASGGVGAGAKVAAGVVASAIFLGALFAAYVSFFAEPDPNVAAEERLASPDVVAIIDGLEVTREEWEFASEHWSITYDCLQETVPGTDDFAQIYGRYLALLDRYPLGVTVFAQLQIARAIEAEGLRRGFEPTSDEITAEVETQRDLIERLANLDEGERPGLCPLETNRQMVGELGEERWEEIRTEQAQRWLPRRRLIEDEGLQLPYGAPYGFELARNADVHLGPELRGLSLDDVMEFLDAYEQLIQLSERGE